MAIKQAVVSVGTSPTRLDTFTEGDYAAGTAAFPRTYGQSVAVHNGSAVVVSVGGADVTTANGYPLAAGADLGVDLLPGDSLYGVVASGTATVNTLQAGV